MKINKNVVPNKSLQHKQQFYQTLFNVRNQIFINKLLDHQLFDTKTFNCKVVQGKNHIHSRSKESKIKDKSKSKLIMSQFKETAVGGRATVTGTVTILD